MELVFKSKHFEEGDISKSFFGEEQEVKNTLQFEHKLINKLNGLRSKELIIADKKSVEEELETKRVLGLFKQKRTDYYEKALKRNLTDLYLVDKMTSIIKSKYISSNEEFVNLLIIMALFDKKNKDALRVYIKTSKAFCNSKKGTDFLICFDENGNIIHDYIFVLESIIRKEYARIIENNCVDCSLDMITNLFYTQEMKDELKEAKHRRKTVIYENEAANHVVYEYNFKKTSSFLDNDKCLRIKAAKYPVDEVIADIQKYEGLTPEQIEEYIAQHEDLSYIDNELSFLDRNLTASEKNKLRSIKRSELYQILLTDEYLSANIAEKRILLFDNLNKVEEAKKPSLNVDNKDKKKNFVIYPTDNFLDTFFGSISSGRNATYEQVSNDIVDRLIKMTNTRLEDLKGESQFHFLDENKMKAVEIDGEKIRRYGTSASKILYICVPGGQKIKPELEEKYGYEPNSRVFLVLDLANVVITDENDKYAAARNNAVRPEVRRMYRNIKDMFNNPTRKEELYALVESSIQQLDKYTPQEVNTNEDNSKKLA